MAQATTGDRKFARPAPAASEKKGLRGGGPSMKVPGDGGIKKPVIPAADEVQPGREAHNARHHADAMSHVGGPSSGTKTYGK